MTWIPNKTTCFEFPLISHEILRLELWRMSNKRDSTNIEVSAVVYFKRFAQWCCSNAWFCSQPGSRVHVRRDQCRRDLRVDGLVQPGKHIDLRMWRALSERHRFRTGGRHVEMGRMQRGPGLRHGVRAEVLGRSGIGRRRSQEPDEFAQQQGRQEGILINSVRAELSRDRYDRGLGQHAKEVTGNKRRSNARLFRWLHFFA